MILTVILLVLSYILILHQTTTINSNVSSPFGCLISLFYIKPQLLPSCFATQSSCLISLFYIKPQLPGTSNDLIVSCLISLFYIKPQPNCFPLPYGLCCLISLFYIKPQLNMIIFLYTVSCLISLFYIKPQPYRAGGNILFVVLYPYSTSNHNLTNEVIYSHSVVLYPYSTSNHNYDIETFSNVLLSYILILHQTTTWKSVS